MPHIGSTVPDHDSIAMLERWIQDMDDDQAQLALPGALRPRLPEKTSALRQFVARVYYPLISILGAFLLYRFWCSSTEGASVTGTGRQSSS